MSELFDSGKVGTKRGSDEEIIKKWNDFGFLDYFEDEYKSSFALKAEDIAFYVISNPGAYKHERMDTVIIPILGQIIREIAKLGNISYEERVGIINAIQVEEVVEIVDKNLECCFELVKNIHGTGDIKKFDWEAEGTYTLSQLIAHKYFVNRHSL
jgi:hypothetical protein